MLTTKKLKRITIKSDYTIVGGGLAGLCSAITAARAGVKVTLVQDRGVLGGNASSEIRVWGLGATSHMGNNNRWAREGGVIDEILLENLYRNPGGNPIFFDNVLLDKVLSEKNITLLLNTAVYTCTSEHNKIVSALAFNSGNQTEYELISPYYCDASGDGIIGYLSGADFTEEGEDKSTYNEPIAPTEDYGKRLGHSIMFCTKEHDKEIKYVAPDFALKDITKIPKYKDIELSGIGCKFWWVEFGGRLNTIYDNEEIKFELWKIIYGIWDYIKNSGKFPEAKNLTLEWASTVTGKRESRRFYGDYVLTQKDIVEQRTHYDAVSHGGWSIDLHPADGVYSDRSPCNQYHAKGVYEIPYRTLYARNIKNLFISGRLISVSHVAFGSTRVMLTGAVNGQAVGQAVALCLKHNLSIKELGTKENIKLLQQSLLAKGQYIPSVKPDHSNNLLTQATITSKDTLLFTGFAKSNEKFIAENKVSLLLPLKKEQILPEFTLFVNALEDTSLNVRLMISQKQQNFTPETILEEFTIDVKQGEQNIVIQPTIPTPQDGYVFIALDNNLSLEIYKSHERVTGIMTVWQIFDDKVAKSSMQVVPSDSGLESFEFWLPIRYPDNHNIAIQFAAPLNIFATENLLNSHYRSVIATNAWVGKFDSNHKASLDIQWDKEISINEITLFFDTNYDHALENTLFDHKMDIMENCIVSYNILDEKGTIVYQNTNNYQTRQGIQLDSLKTSKLTIEINETAGLPPAIFGIICT